MGKSTEIRCLSAAVEMWAYVHGIAVLCASGQQNWDDALISRMLTDGFEGIKSRFQKNEQ